MASLSLTVDASGVAEAVSHACGLVDRLKGAELRAFADALSALMGGDAFATEPRLSGGVVYVDASPELLALIARHDPEPVTW